MCASKSEEQVQAVKILRLQVGMWKKKITADDGVPFSKQWQSQDLTLRGANFTTKIYVSP